MHWDINQREGFSVIRRMNYRMTGSVFLTFKDDTDAFRDGFDKDGKTFLFRGMDYNDHSFDPKKTDQLLVKKSGSKSENQIFKEVVERYKKGGKAEKVRLYEKIATNKWVDKGVFELVDVKFGSYPPGSRKIFVFMLRLS